MNCTRCEDCLPGPARGLRCRFSGAEVTHDAELEAICPRNLTLENEEDRCVARTVLAVTLLLDPRGKLLELLLSRYNEWMADRLRGLLRGKALATAVHGRDGGKEITSPSDWEGRFGPWAGATERAPVMAHAGDSAR